MTPLHLNILLHYYSHDDDWVMPTQTHLDYAQNHLDDGMLTKDHNRKTKLAITDKGRFFIDYILSLPLPESSYTISVD